MALLLEQPTKRLNLSFKIMNTVLIFVVAIIATVTCLPPIRDVSSFGYCHIGNVYIKEGERGPGSIGECNMYSCKSAKAGDVTISIHICAEVIPRRGCQQYNYDYTKQYPACCPKQVCPPELE
ncbi:hypothetical protein ILUMI_14206 [Ignelater luminosus]|uniref:Single domain-containing protein n=1 Tax=Ignelater luminosus TaxID=2038154 RepID=A0A8K0CX11_IGNLU|nr:hypothetical protein ILUMI_14206 [Ignelater luminosus]